ncbi:ACP S-malonyltransferase [Isobaculum melis]|uniref:Malonyl CoA-acyl carrier protein transacylase n=1 Tax=Isobaculum melis TaxID=142588 RepID=A0A1H9RBJ8_9LACT|nr:ACP S-malonyltransferase [Isobaculum melis]SER69915.1 [Acyl-carrier-protein] S-malonyltransferase [Isobaculum melis]
MRKIAFIYPGQGSQVVGMADFVKEDPTSEQQLNTLQSQLDFDLIKTMHEGPSEQLTASEMAQPALVATSSLLTDYLARHDLQADYVAGHSLGEYSALVASGMLPLSVAVPLVRQRGKLMNAAMKDVSGGMSAVLGLTQEVIDQTLAKINADYEEPVLFAANVNAPGQIVISGQKEALASHIDTLKEAGAKRVLPLKVSGAFHSGYMQPAAMELNLLLAKLAFKAPNMTFINNVDAQTLNDPNEIVNKLTLQLTSPVLWTQTIEAMLAAGVTDFIEIGPGKVLTGLMKKIKREAITHNVCDIETANEVLTTLKEEV